MYNYILSVSVREDGVGGIGNCVVSVVLGIVWCRWY